MEYRSYLVESSRRASWSCQVHFFKRSTSHLCNQGTEGETIAQKADYFAPGNAKGLMTVSAEDKDLRRRYCRSEIPRRMWSYRTGDGERFLSATETELQS